MKSPKRMFLPLLSLLGILGGCATTTTDPGSAAHDEENLRDSDNDILFATEFPVAGKEDALLRADEARTAGDLDRALYFYVKALKFDPEDADLLAAIGVLHQHQGNDELAARAYTLAIDVRPQYVPVLEARGLIFLRHEQEEQAHADFIRAIELDPTRWRSHNALGLIADSTGAHQEAIQHYDRALAHKPDSAEVLNNRGYSHFLAGDYTEAEADLSKAAMTFGHTQAWVNLGSLYARQGEYGRAVDAFRKVLPEPEAYNKVAEASMAREDYSTAETLLQQAIRSSPTYYPAAEDNLQELRQQFTAVGEN
jgi:tetratricopeptide (TPR) repeat protein